MKRIAAIILTILLLTCPQFVVRADDMTVIVASPVEYTVRSGETFTITIVVIPARPIKSIELELHTDPTLFQPIAVSNGGMFPRNFAVAIHDDDTVIITGFFNDRTTTSRAIFAYITMKANSTRYGTAILALSGVKVRGMNDENLPFITVNSRITVTPVYFVTATHGTYPSVPGVHNGTIKPRVTVRGISALYTFSCPGTAGHTEKITIRNNTWSITAEWDGYNGGGDWHIIKFPQRFDLIANHTYHYTIRTGSYPVIIHRHSITNQYGTIICTSFRDVNGNLYDDWIPAVMFTDI